MVFFFWKMQPSVSSPEVARYYYWLSLSHLAVECLRSALENPRYEWNEQSVYSSSRKIKKSNIIAADWMEGLEEEVKSGNLFRRRMWITERVEKKTAEGNDDVNIAPPCNGDRFGISRCTWQSTGSRSFFIGQVEMKHAGPFRWFIDYEKTSYLFGVVVRHGKFV